MGDSATRLPAIVREEQLGTSSQHEPLMHDHVALELVRVDTGSMDCIVGNQSMRLEPGDACLINASRMHRAKQIDGHPCSYSVMHLDPAQLTRDEEVYARYIAPVLNDDSFNFMLGRDCEGTAGEICRLMEQIGQLQRDQPPAYELEVIALAHLVFKQIYLRRVALAERSDAIATDQDGLSLRAMTAHIYAHFGERVTLDDIAAAGGVSRSKASVLFKERLDSAPVEFLNRYRLEVAEHLLASSDDTVARIAAACGFSQQSYFNRVFMRAHDMTPKQYRMACKAQVAA